MYDFLVKISKLFYSHLSIPFFFSASYLSILIIEVIWYFNTLLNYLNKKIVWPLTRPFLATFLKVLLCYPRRSDHPNYTTGNCTFFVIILILFEISSKMVPFLLHFGSLSTISVIQLLNTSQHYTD